MSTIDVQNINSKTGNSAITISDAGTVSAGGNEVVTTQSAQLGRRNLIINGAMQVAQRGTNVTGKTTNGYYTVDRFRQQIGSLGTWTIDQSTDAPDGFSNSYKITCTTADASPASSDYVLVNYFIEAQDLQRLAFGTSSAKTMTLSFWVKSNKTGNATFDIQQLDNSNKRVSKQYTINSADTWEYKTISIPADSSGVINNDNGAGLELDWWMNSGSNFNSGSHQSAWTTYAQSDSNPSNLGVGGATSDYFAITGVQLEVGDTATPFEHRSFGEELALCQRYYHQTETYGTSTNYTFLSVVFYHAYVKGAEAWEWVSQSYPCHMRASPTITVSDASGNLGKILHFTSTGGGSTNNHTPYGVGGTKEAVRVNEYFPGSIYGFAFSYSADAEL